MRWASLVCKIVEHDFTVATSADVFAQPRWAAPAPCAATISGAWPPAPRPTWCSIDLAQAPHRPLPRSDQGARPVRDDRRRRAASSSTGGQWSRTAACVGVDEARLLADAQREAERLWAEVPEWHWQGLTADELSPPTFPSLPPTSAADRGYGTTSRRERHDDLDRRSSSGRRHRRAAAAPWLPPRRPPRHRGTGGTLRFVPIADLKILDPIWTTAYITRDHGVHDLRHAVRHRRQPPVAAPDGGQAHGQPRPDEVDASRCATACKFHDGQPVTAEDCVVSLCAGVRATRWVKLLLAATGKLQAADRKTFVLELSPSRSGSCWRRWASRRATSRSSCRRAWPPPPERAGEGADRLRSLPVRQGASGSRATRSVYVENPDYVPAQRADPSGAAGGKRVYLDRVVMALHPEPATAAAAIETGEIDYWWLPPADFVARLEKNPEHPGVRRGSGGHPGLAPAQPPAPALRQQEGPAGAAVAGGPGAVAAGRHRPAQVTTGRARRSSCAASMPYESSAGAPRPDLERARQLLREGGYDGRPLVVLDPTDRPEMHGAALVLRDQLQKIGAKVDLVSLDWSTVIARRAEEGTARRRAAGTSCTPPGSPPTSTTRP